MNTKGFAVGRISARPRARVVSVNVAVATTGLLTSVSTFGLLAPVTFAKTGGSSNLAVNSSTGGISATGGIAEGVSQVASGTITGADGCVVPFSYTLTGVVPIVVPAAPTVTLTAGDGQLSIAWTDGSNGGATITAHRIYVNGTPMSPYAGASPYVLTGLANDIAVSIGVAAINSAGEGSSSSAQSLSPHGGGGGVHAMPMLVVPLVGQSNIAGRYAFTAEDVAEMPSNVRQFANVASDTGTYRTLLTSVLPLYHPENLVASNYYGPGNAIIREIALANPDKIVVAVPCGWGATTLVTTNGPGTTGAPQWIEPTGNLNVSAVNQINALMAANPTATLHSIHWILGENDAGAGTPATQAEVEAGLSALITGWRSRITGNSTSVPFVIGALGTVSSASAESLAAKAAFAALATSMTNVKNVTGVLDYDDGLHYIRAGAKGIGIAMGRTALGSAPGTILTTDFTAANGSTLQSVGWIKRTGADALIVGNKAYLTGTGSVYAAPYPIFGTNDYAFGGTFTFVNRASSQEAALDIRTSGGSSMIGYQWRYLGTVGSGRWELRRFDGSSGFGTGGTVLGTYADDVVNGTRIPMIDVRGDTIRGLVDGVERVSVTDATYTTPNRTFGLAGKSTSSTQGIFIDDVFSTTAAV